MLYITHDQSEAMALADRIAVMTHGRVEQLAAPQTLYRSPATPFVADFIGIGGLVQAILPAPAAGGQALIRDRRPPRHRPRGRGSAGRSRARLLAPGRSDAGRPRGCRPLPPRPLSGRRMAGGTDDRRQDDCELQMLAKPGAVPEPGAAVRLRITDGWVIPGER